MTSAAASDRAGGRRRSDDHAALVADLVTTDPACAADRLDRGGLAALPTETVYGLAADAANDAALERVFAIKSRPPDHPLIAHFADAPPTRWVDEGWIDPGWSDTPTRSGRSRLQQLEVLADAFWPGPLTVIVGAGPRVSPLVTGGRSTVGIRVPDHPDTARVLDLLSRPVAAPSANRFGRVSPTELMHVIDDIGDLLIPGVDIILDGGPTVCGVESTIVDLSGEHGDDGTPQVLRHGAISDDDIAARIGDVATASGPARSSGMLAAHYAPLGFVAIAETAVEANALADRYRADGLVVEVIDRSANPEDAARWLYTDLRRANRADIAGVVVVAPPARGIGIAVRDRLQRAATGSSPPSPEH